MINVCKVDINKKFIEHVVHEIVKNIFNFDWNAARHCELFDLVTV